MEPTNRHQIPEGAAGTTGRDRSPLPAPTAPRRLADTGLNEQLITELVSKQLYLRGEMRLVDLAQQLRLPAALIEDTCALLRAERLVELLRRGATAADVDYGLTESGHARAAEYFRKCSYVGPAPVTLDDYTAQVRRQSAFASRITEGDIERVYEGMVVRSELRHLIGTAMNSDRPIFFYGPAGSGKSYLAETLVGLLRGSIYVPHALFVDGEIIQIFDPAIHCPISPEAPRSGLDNRERQDERWVACARPVAISGGELTLDRLDLQYSRLGGYYQAPAQVKANNGLYIIDDLGRQLIRPEQLMNRWIVPMDRRRDYLRLHTGSTFEIPFDVKLVFATNITPQELADEAFLRRLGYKIHVGPVSEEEYGEIFIKVCQQLGFGFDADSLDFLLEMHRRSGRLTLACHPSDILCHVRDHSAYRERPAALAPEMIEWAWHSYFAGDA